jgi:hypothetical protein
MVKHRRAANAAYALTLLLLIVPAWDAIASIYPFRTGELRWRLGALGVTSSSLMVPLVGIVLALLVAVANDHRRIQTSMRVLGGLVAGLALVSVVLFGLDAIQARAGVRADVMTGFGISVAGSFLKYVLAIGVGVVIALAGSARKDSKSDGKILINAAK